MHVNRLGGRGVRSWWWWLVGCLVLCTTVRAEVRTLREAQVTATVNGQSVSRQVELPYRWDREHPGEQGEAVFNFQFDLPRDTAPIWGIYLPRLGNAYAIWLNGTLLQQQGQLSSGTDTLPEFNGDDFARAPRYITVDAGHFAATNHLRIQIRADRGRRGGLSAVIIGPQEQVLPLYTRDYRWRVTGSVLVATVSLVVGLMALVFWFAQSHDHTAALDRQREPLYLFAALAQLCLTLSVVDVKIESPPIPWPWWGVLQVLALGIWACSMVLACMEVAGWRQRRLAQRVLRWLLLLMVICPFAATAGLAYGYPLVLTVWYVVFGVSLLGFALALLRHAWRMPGLELRVVALAAVLNAAVALRDIYVFRFVPAYADNTLLRYASLAFPLALGVMIFIRFRDTSAQLRDLLRTLSSRVSERERDLRTSYQRLEVLAREQERAAERSRILRNMHDGVGAHLSAAIRQMQTLGSGPHDPAHAEVLMTLQDALDHLKLNIDAMHLAPGDVTALLANLRYRLEPRFSAMGISMVWDVDLLPDCPLDSSAMRELQFMLFEALSNVLQHAHARTLRIEGHVRDAQVVLRVVDDGRGFDPEGDARRGMASLRERSVSIGAVLLLRSQPGQTVVEIRLTTRSAG